MVWLQVEGIAEYYVLGFKMCGFVSAGYCWIILLCDLGWGRGEAWRWNYEYVLDREGGLSPVNNKWNSCSGYWCVSRVRSEIGRKARYRNLRTGSQSSITI
jgi:hypothetical protein